MGPLGGPEGLNHILLLSFMSSECAFFLSFSPEVTSLKSNFQYQQAASGQPALQTLTCKPSIQETFKAKTTSLKNGMDAGTPVSLYWFSLSKELVLQGVDEPRRGQMSVCRQENPNPSQFFITSISNCTFTTQRQSNTTYTQCSLGTGAQEWSSETIRSFLTRHQNRKFHRGSFCA